MARQIGYGAQWNDEDWPEESRRRRSSRTGRFMEGSRAERRGRGRERMYDEGEEGRDYESRSRGRRGSRSEMSRGESRSRRGSGRDGYD